MFQRDYILRLVEQLSKTLGAVLTLKKARRFDEAELAVSEAAKNLVGLDVKTLLALPVCCKNKTSKSAENWAVRTAWQDASAAKR